MASAVAPVVVKYVPALQLVHSTLPVAVLYFPATQATHVPQFGPEYPRLHAQTPTLVCAASACAEFAGQATHAALPAADLYVLAPHTEQMPALPV